MQHTSPFKIYNASAGSGKTFTLVKEYLKLVLRTKKEGAYKNLLAITFTNKAVAEMKQRIIKSLVDFSNADMFDDPTEMFLQIANELDISSEELRLRSENVLTHLLHHYASFNVETIDRFNHQLIRTFARDLKLPQNFEVSLELPELIAEATDQLINKAGEDEKITKLLLDFAIEKTDDDRSWDIARDISQASQILLSENDASHVKTLKDKTLDDFINFKQRLITKKNNRTAKIVSTARQTLQIIEESGLQFDDFSSSYLPKHFRNLSEKKFDINFNAKWQETMDSKPLYPKRVDASIASIIDELTPEFIVNFSITKQQVYEVLLLESVLKNLTPLSVINLVRQELELIKEERGILPISEFNALINKEIKQQPAPFIYERLGERYRHFFIDEFQDTSLLQWQNLIPLIDNSLSQEDLDGNRGSLLLVGDAKQSIYRWRGGLPEQFINLYSGEHPFSTGHPEILDLSTNYRSCKEIILFNNAFFSFIAPYFGNRLHENLYQLGNKQFTTDKGGGYVQFEFITSENKEASHEIYSECVYTTILGLLENKFKEEDICILTRTKKEGILLGAALMEKGMSIVSSETLLLQYSDIVQCIVDTLTLHLFPENEEIKISVLSFLYDHFEIKEPKHSFFKNFIGLPSSEFEALLASYGIFFSFKDIQSISLYESCEYIIKQFQLNRNPDGYLFGFMDLVFEFQLQPKSGKLDFITYWDSKKETASIAVGEHSNAIRLMTIHKAKGLEFPVVIFPYANVDIYKEINAKAWFPWDDPNFHEVQINYNSNVAFYGDVGREMTQDRRNTLELDTINLLYVTLTRAVEQLYVFSELPKPIKEKPSNFNQLFGEFFKSLGLWDGSSPIIKFGSTNRALPPKEEGFKETESLKFTTTLQKEHKLKIVSKDALLWETDAEKAIDIGNMLHDTMALIKNKGDIASVFQDFEVRAIISPKELSILQKTIKDIVNHPKLEHLYNVPEENVVNERDIITYNGEILRPDRIVFQTHGNVSIIDYKTGVPIAYHEDQINKYAEALTEMNYKVEEKLLVYTSEEKIVVNKV